jgi:hypothetical protein
MIAAKRREKKKWLRHRIFLFTSKKNDKFVEQEKLHLKVEYMLRYIK